MEEVLMSKTIIEFARHELGTVVTACYEEWFRSDDISSLAMAVKLCPFYISLLDKSDPIRHNYEEHLQLWENELIQAVEDTKVSL
jgi:hypothetical protein